MPVHTRSSSLHRRRSWPPATRAAHEARDRLPAFLVAEELPRSPGCGGRCELPCVACTLALRVARQGAFTPAPRARDDTADFVPRPQAIAEGTRKIRAEWSAKERKSRRALVGAVRWSMPETVVVVEG